MTKYVKSETVRQPDLQVSKCLLKDRYLLLWVMWGLKKRGSDKISETDDGSTFFLSSFAQSLSNCL